MKADRERSSRGKAGESKPAVPEKCISWKLESGRRQSSREIQSTYAALKHRCFTGRLASGLFPQPAKAAGLRSAGQPKAAGLHRSDSRGEAAVPTWRGSVHGTGFLPYNDAFLYSQRSEVLAYSFS